MGLFPEDKVLQVDHCLSSLEEQISVFYGEDSSDFHRPFEDDSGGDDESNIGGSHDSLEQTVFWESKQDLLLEILEHGSSTGLKLSREVSKALERARDTALCQCINPSFNGCSKCLRRTIVDQLRDEGLNAAVCTSKWKSMAKTPGGTHEYIDVIFGSLGHKKKQSRYLIELEFRAEFEMAKACDEYRRLINLLPESFIGKPEQLNAILSVVCDAAKRSMSEMKIHMGPWRKRRFMQLKWSAPYQRCSSKHQSSIDSVLSSQVHMPISRYYLQFTAPTALEVT
ncbi:hypothetical protein NE237_027323 [Protea cynaroides]|uniref:Uncharacterized protein n=1 Tax=Protea cynaroides TaxID=273540 RepID=A0A9Q0JSV3_9MAGN|nr:hypothetical protein NE237_027323 [Protea cynaroides]